MHSLENKKEEYKKKCFFCSKIIEGNKSLEHIIPNSLLKKLNLKEKELSGNFPTQYSRLKVPAHSSCNSNFGSVYEDKIIRFLDNTDCLYESIIRDDQLDIIYNPEYDSISLITTWLSKIYYGLFYNDFLKTNDNEYRNSCYKIIKSKNFKLTQKSYQNNYGFNLPSSIYAFRTNKTTFNLITLIYPSTILLKISGLILILCIADGYLTKNYLNSFNINSLNDYLEKNDELDNFPTDLFALAEITSLRQNIPKTPSFIFSDNKMINMSFSTGVQNPEEYYKIDENAVINSRNKILASFGVQLH